MSTIETVVYLMALVWLPPLIFVAYLLLPKRPAD